ncbi:MAG: hypothetical protein ACOYM8_17020, partial [Caulobacterales bacterium]
GNDIVNETTGNTNTIILGDGFNWNDFWIGTPPGQLHIGTRSVAGTLIINNAFALPLNPISTIDMGGAGAIDTSKITWAVAGDDANNTVTGQNNQSNWLLGFNGNDTITNGGWSQLGSIYIGGRGNDTINSSVGDDQIAIDRGSGQDVINDTGGADSLIIGPTATADDVIFKIVGDDLFIGLRDPANGALEANLVADRVRVVGGGVKYREWYWNNIDRRYDPSDITTINTVEFIVAGGATMDLTKLDMPWVVRDRYNGSGGGGGGGPLPPVVFDLGDDGLDLIAVEESDVVFKPNGNGPMLRVGWVGGQDGILALDRDKSGAIDNLKEIMFTQDKPGAKTDLEGLAGFDNNKDGLLNSKDKIWSDLRIWRDVNGNGLGAGRELMTMTEAGIVELDLTPKPTGYKAGDSIDNMSVNTTTFRRANGTIGTAHDVLLQTRLVNVDSYDTGKPRAEWGAPTNDGQLGRVAGVGVQKDSRAKLRVGDVAPDQKDAAFEKGDVTKEGKTDLPAIVPRRGRLQQLEEDLRKGTPTPSAGRGMPIVIDLAGDGADLIDPSKSQVFVDLDSDGWADQVGWVAASDAILGYDRDGDGRIAPLGEISFINDFVGAKSDLEGLRAFDSDGDLMLTAADEKFAGFMVWRDLNSDGRSTAEELQSLAKAGVVSIALEPFETNADPGEMTQNAIFGATRIAYADGTMRTGYDVALGSIGGLARALQNTMPSEKVRNTAPTEVYDRTFWSGQPWAMTPAIRRAIMGVAEDEGALEDDIGIRDDLDLLQSGRIGAEADGEAVFSPTQDFDMTSANSERGKDVTELAQMFPFEPSIGEDVFSGRHLDQPEIEAPRTGDRRWWLRGSERTFDGAGSLAALMDRLDDEKMAESRAQRFAPANQDAVILAQSMAAFAKPSGGEARTRRRGEDPESGYVSLPSLWRRERV